MYPIPAQAANSTLTGTPTAPTPSTNDDSIKIATTAYVKSNLSDYVTLDTVQNITGKKSFSHVIINSDGSWQNGFKFINPKLTTEDPPSSSAFNTINYYGANNIRTGCVENYVSTTNDTFTKLVAIQHSSAASGSCELGVKVLADGTKQTFAPTPATADNSTQIATTAFVKNVLTSLNPQIEQFGFGQNNSAYSTKPWLYLGQCNMPTQTNMMIFEIYGGNGQNGNSSQNLYIKIMLKRGYSTSGVGVTAWVFSGDVANQYSYSSGIDVKGIKDPTGNILDLYVKMPYAYPSGTCILTNLSSSSFTSNFTFVAEPSGTNANCHVLFFNPSTYI